MANQISQLADAVSRLDTQYRKLPSQFVSNVRNVITIFVVSCTKSYLTSVFEFVIEPIQDVNKEGVGDAKEKTTSLPRRCGVSFDPPLNLTSYVSCCSFPY